LFFKGGFSDKSFNSNEAWIKSEKVFIFSLSNPENKPTKFKVIDPSKSAWDDPTDGPVFGEDDINIHDNSNQNNRSYTDLGKNFSGKINFYFLFFF
jgi:hypothetical protein